MASFVTLVADGGDMTVGRRTAAYTYGSWQVMAPDEAETPESDDRIQDGYIYRPDDAPSGKFDLAFVRADATVDMQEGTSDVEQALDSASRRVSGDAFFERDIAGRGLGRYVPGIDFVTGDVVDVRIWGRSLALPVTAIDMLTGTSGRWRVHVGGQLISDAELLRTQNAQVQEAIDAARRRAAKEAIDASTRQAAASAQTAADDAAAATEALGDSLELVALQQEQIDAEQDARIEAQDQLIDALRQIQLATLHSTTVTLVASGGAAVADGDMAIAAGADASVTAAGSWVGKVIVHAAWATSRINPTDGGNVTDHDQRSVLREFSMPHAGSRTVSIDSLSSTRDWVRVDYQIEAGRQEIRDLESGGMPVPHDVWTSVPALGWTVPEDASDISIAFDVGWDAAIFTSSHGLRVLVNGTPIKTWGPRVNIGPLIGSGYRRRGVSISGLDLPAESEVVFEVWSGSSAEAARYVRGTSARISWIQKNV